jgi:prevent-host-death family protein
MRTATSVEAQNRFGELLDTVQREPVAITRRGRTAAVIVSGEAWQALAERAAARGGEVAAYFNAIKAFRGQGSGGAVARLLAERAADRTP